MSNNALRKVRDLSPDVRNAMEVLLGRPLQEGETVSIQTYPTHEAPAGREREGGWKRLLDRIDRAAARARDVAEGDLDSLIDEANEYVRRQRAA